jgi:hypothetical protein
MNPAWKQQTPHDQLTVILMALEGHFENLQNDVIDVPKYVARTAPLIEQLNELKPYLKGERPWYAETQYPLPPLNPDNYQPQPRTPLRDATMSPELFTLLADKAKRQTPTFP